MASWIEAKGTGRKVTRHELAHVFASGISCSGGPDVWNDWYLPRPTGSAGLEKVYRVEKIL